MNLLFKIAFFIAFTLVFVDPINAQNSKKNISDSSATPSVQRVIFDENKSIEAVMIYSTRQIKHSNVVATVSEVSQSNSEVSNSEDGESQNKTKVIETKLAVKDKATIVNPSVTKVE